LVLDDVKLYTPDQLPSTFPSCGVDIYSADIYTANVYPNPATNRLNIDLIDTKIAKITLYDCLSRELLIHEFVRSTSIDIGLLPEAVYYYRVTNSDGQFKTGKFLKN
jgi:hypothetical protein